MTDAEAVRITRVHVENQFPKTCGCCGKVFATLGDYLVQTRHVGPPVSYDAEEGDWTPSDPLGTLSLANCSCGSTVAIDSRGMPLQTLARLMMWARRESARRHFAMRRLLEWVRAQIDEQVLREGGVLPEVSAEEAPQAPGGSVPPRGS